MPVSEVEIWDSLCDQGVSTPAKATSRIDQAVKGSPFKLNGDLKLFGSLPIIAIHFACFFLFEFLVLNMLLTSWKKKLGRKSTECFRFSIYAA